MDETLTMILNHVNKVLNTSLDKENINYSIFDEKEFYVKTLENGLIGLVFPNIIENNISTKLYKSLELDFYSYLNKDILQRSLILKLKETLNTNEIRFILLKGSHLKNIYPESYMRGMGDIDILIDKDNQTKVKNIFKELNINLISVSSSHDVYKSNNGLYIEILQI